MSIKESRTENIEDRYKVLFETYKQSLSDQEKKLRPSSKRIYRDSLSIPDRIKNQKAELENKAIEQDITLKKITLLILFCFLAVETVVIFVTAFFQGFQFKGFLLEEWSFRLVISATITQITVMLLVAVRHIFPRK